MPFLLHFFVALILLPSNKNARSDSGFCLFRSFEAEDVAIKKGLYAHYYFVLLAVCTSMHLY